MVCAMPFIVACEGYDDGGDGDGDGDGDGGEPEEPEPYDPVVAAVYNQVDGEWELIHVNEAVPNDWVALFDTTPAEGEAEPFVDYGSDGMRIEFPIDADLALVAVPIIDDIETEPTEVFGMILSNP